jgi:glycosyltransferase involved in cell wall biosynthesis
MEDTNPSAQARPHRRVLVLSHNAFSDTHNNGKTLASFFAGWPRDKLAQMYLKASPAPSYAVCGRFYRVTDYAALRALLRGGKAEGAAFAGAPGEDRETPEPAHGAEDSPGLSGLFARRLPLLEWGRDLLWRNNRWQSPALLAWLDDFAPEAVFFQGSNYPFAYDIALWVCARYGARLLLQLTDDYTYVPHPLLPLSWHNHFRYMGRLREAMATAKAVYAIGPAMREEYAGRFGREDIAVAANCVEVSPCTSQEAYCGGCPEKPLRLVYAGSVHTGRWRVLRRLGACLRALRDEGLYAVLEVYTPASLSPRLTRALTLEPTLAWRGSLTPAELRSALARANALVMVEAFSRSARRVTRLSLSTKIPEYMAAGRCMLAVGPAEASSIRYVREQGAGVVIDDTRREAMLRSLRALFDAETRADLVRKALRVAQENHGREALQADLYRRIQA